MYITVHFILTFMHTKLQIMWFLKIYMHFQWLLGQKKKKKTEKLKEMAETIFLDLTVLKP